ncbi:MAG TPA: HAD-IIB family hydrolase [Intrasporangium sp.]|uniref:HAD family hydrolase n=1 Tax=Intrasporangium sp. TaxID=1925024 RepID=UPI002D79DC79|nr:HAD-IIB family hydrolase [Intrasporangium sp.]HET7397731.1 HAD-IIB family hydrolase [Intrasporangium sp.]
MTTRPPRLVATDLDGTLLRSDGTLSERTARALRAAADAGIEVVFVTARPPRWLDALAGAVAGHGTVICGNGAFVYEVGTRLVRDVRGFSPELLREVVRGIRQAVPDAAFAAERTTGLWWEPGFTHDPDHPVGQESVVGPIEQLDQAVVGKLLARSASLPAAEFLDRVARSVGARAQVAYSGAGGLAEINARGVTKAAALERWAARLGIGPADVWAFGDMPNDLPMLRWAGVAHAVANAHPDVRAAADRRCASNDDDGVARVLEELLAKV